MRALLLGNGFSIGYSKSMFSYDGLIEGARFPDHLREVFDTVGTSDFEHVMRRLNQACELLLHYRESAGLRKALRADSKLVRDSLIQALMRYHPHRADLLAEEDKDRCSAFLRRYDRIFTLNYDLLLYWVIYPRLRNCFSDGFRGYQTIAWQQEQDGQNIYYMHGALHLYREGRGTIKRTYIDSTPILDQLRTAMTGGQFPLFVSEGSWQQKMAAIEDSTYLKACYDALVGNRQAITLYGFSFHRNDQHIVDALARSRAKSLEIVLHSQAPSSHRRRIRERAETLRERMSRRQDRDIQLEFSESDDYQVWR